MQKPIVYITRYTLSSLFEKSLKLLGATWKSSAVTAAIVHVPLGAATVVFLQAYFRFIIDLSESGSSGPEALALLAKSAPVIALILLYFVVAAVLQGFCAGFVSRNGYRAATEDRLPWGKLFAEILNARFGKILGFILLQGLIYVGVVVALLLVAALGVVLIAVQKAAAVTAIAVILIVLGYLGALAAIGFLAAILQLGIPLIANDGLGAGAAIGKCFRLVKGQVFRVLGISILFYVGLSFAVSLMTMPLQFASIAPLYAKLIQSMLSGTGGSDFLGEYMNAVRTMAIPMALAIAVSAIISAIVQPLFQTLLCVDLKVRSGDLPDAAEFSDLGNG